jgi:hypothetical protein
MGTVPILNQMSFEAFRRLTHMIEIIGNPLYASFGRAVKNEGVLCSYFDDQVQKRGLFIAEFCRLEPRLYNLNELNRETKVREKFPWHWISAVESDYPAVAAKEIVNVIERNKANKKEIDRLLIRAAVAEGRELDCYSQVRTDLQGKVSRGVLRQLDKYIAINSQRQSA